MADVKKPLESIRAKCLECMSGSSKEVKLCPSSDCALHQYRFGSNPNHKRNLTDEQRAALSVRMKNLHKASR